MTVNNVDQFNKLKDRLIRRTGSAGMTSFAGGNKVSMSLAEYERLVTYAEWNKTTMDKSAYEAMLTERYGDWKNLHVGNINHHDFGAVSDAINEKLINAQGSHEGMLTHEKGAVKNSTEDNREDQPGTYTAGVMTEADRERMNKARGTQSVIVPNVPVVFTQNPERARDAEQVLRLIEIIKETGGAVEIQGVRIEPIEQVERRVK